MAKKSSAPTVDMQSVFDALAHCEQAHGVRIALLVFPVQLPELGARFGLAVKVYDSSGRVIREITSSRCYWPTNKYSSWEAAALDCIYAVEKELTETYLPLIDYIAGLPTD